MLDRELAPDARCDAVDEIRKLRGVAKGDRDALEPAVTLDEDPVGRVHQNVGDSRIVEQRLQATEAEEIRAQTLQLRVREPCAGGAPHALADEPTAGRVGVQREQRRRMETGGDLVPNTRDEGRVDQATLRISGSSARAVGARTANSSPARNGSRGTQARTGHGSREPIRAASSGAALTTTAPIRVPMPSSNAAEQNAACSWDTDGPTTTQRRSSAATTSPSRASAPEPRSMTRGPAPRSRPPSSPTRGPSNVRPRPADPRSSRMSPHRESKATSLEGRSSASQIVAHVPRARIERVGARRSRSIRTGGRPPAAERWATSAAAVDVPTPALRAQNPMHRSSGSPSRRTGTA